MRELFDILLNLHEHLASWAESYGPWIYAILFLVVFCETGLVVTPFLPGDSLHFAVGALCGSGVLELHIAGPLLLLAAVLGNCSNYWIGRATGPRIFRGDSRSLLGRLMSRRHLESAHRFYEKHGGKAVILGQFLPIIRTFVPYVAGAGAMNFRRFVVFTVLGAVLWVGVCSGAGYLFGQHPFVKEHFELVVVGIIAVSIIPIGIQVVRSRMKKTQPAAEGGA
jgi:membrane-associated protein